MADYKVSFTVKEGALEKAIDRIFCDVDLVNPLQEHDFRGLLAGLNSEADKSLVMLFWFIAHAKRGVDIDGDALKKMADALYDFVIESSANPFCFDWIKEPEAVIKPRQKTLMRGLSWVWEIVWMEKRNVPVTVTMHRIAEREGVAVGTVEKYYYEHPKGVAYRDESAATLRNLKNVYPEVCGKNCPGCWRCCRG